MSWLDVASLIWAVVMLDVSLSGGLVLVIPSLPVNCGDSII
jgi:hypothetical protein